EWNQNETYNLYVSDTSGVYYTLALENVVSSMGLEGNIMVDLYELMSSCGCADRIKSAVLIGVATQDASYAKSPLRGRLKYLPITKVEFHGLMQPSETRFSPAAAPPGPPAGSQIHLRHTLITHNPPDGRSFSTQRLSLCLVNPIKINGKAGQWGGRVCDEAYDLGGLRIQVDATAKAFTRVS
ncbi:hypothetical protein XENOCAPTIV_015207, partial [Xenoophorus captivus]